MNFCSVESEAVSAPITIPASRTTSPPPTRTASPTPSPWPWHPSTSSFLPPSHNLSSAAIDATSPRDPWEAAADEWTDDMDLESEAGSEDEMSEFEEGLDVLMMLERAYESAIKAHVTRASPAASSAAEGPGKSDEALGTRGGDGRNPIMQGSSTALVAVLDHSPRPRAHSSRSHSPAPSRTQPHTPSLAQPQPRVRSPLVPNLSPSPGPTTRALLHPSPPLPSITEGKEKRDSGAVLKIAHLGDCMGMLVRGDEIVWRSEEMWWSVSLSPSDAISVNEY